MFAIENVVVESGSETQMRSVGQLATMRDLSAFNSAALILGYWLAATRGHIRAYAGGNYLLTAKGEKRRLQLAAEATST